MQNKKISKCRSCGNIKLTSVKLIRGPVNDIRIAGRQTQGVTLFNVSDDEKVVSVAKLEENE